MIGIGITTRNRPDILDLCLYHFSVYAPEQSHIFVVEDNSDPEYAEYYKDLSVKYPQVEFVRNESRLGIAKSKNRCITRFQGDYDHVFLFDDDCFPAALDWYQPFVTLPERGIQHAMYLPLNMREHVIILGDDGHMTEAGNCIGVMLYFSKYALDILGGYDNRFGIYGFEHAQISKRAFEAGLTKVHYGCPLAAETKIFSMDMHYQWRHQALPLDAGIPFTWKSSIIGEDRDILIAANAPIWIGETQIYCQPEMV